MATKKKSSAPKKGKGGDPELKKALDGLDKASKDLSLHVKTIRKAMGNRFGTGGPGDGHTFHS
jgi:hypothetical protein